jgi:hypothetical protein
MLTVRAINLQNHHRQHSLHPLWPRREPQHHHRCLLLLPGGLYRVLVRSNVVIVCLFCLSVLFVCLFVFVFVFDGTRPPLLYTFVSCVFACTLTHVRSPNVSCIPCPMNFHKPNNGSGACIGCGIFGTTLANASTSCVCAAGAEGKRSPFAAIVRKC